MPLSEETQCWMLFPSPLKHDDETALCAAERHIHEAHPFLAGHKIRRGTDGVEDYQASLRTLRAVDGGHGCGRSIHRVQFRLEPASLSPVRSQDNHVLSDIWYGPTQHVIHYEGGNQRRRF